MADESSIRDDKSKDATRSYITKGLLICILHILSLLIFKLFLLALIQPSPNLLEKVYISLYNRKIFFSFLSVWGLGGGGGELKEVIS